MGSCLSVTLWRGGGQMCTPEPRLPAETPTEASRMGALSSCIHWNIKALILNAASCQQSQGQCPWLSAPRLRVCVCSVLCTLKLYRTMHTCWKRANIKLFQYYKAKHSAPTFPPPRGVNCVWRGPSWPLAVHVGFFKGHLGTRGRWPLLLFSRSVISTSLQLHISRNGWDQKVKGKWNGRGWIEGQPSPCAWV